VVSIQEGPPADITEIAWKSTRLLGTWDIAGRREVKGKCCPPLAQNTLMSALPVHDSFLSFEHLHAMDQQRDADFVFCLRVC